MIDSVSWGQQEKVLLDSVCFISLPTPIPTKWDTVDNRADAVSKRAESVTSMCRIDFVGLPPQLKSLSYSIKGVAASPLKHGHHAVAVWGLVGSIRKQSCSNLDKFTLLRPCGRRLPGSPSDVFNKALRLLETPKK